MMAAIQGVGLINPVLQFEDGNGIPYAAGTVSFYAAGTTVLQNIYSDTALLVPLANPMTLNASGRSSSDGTNTSPVYFLPLAYDYTLKDSTGVVIYGPETFSGSIWPGSLQGITVLSPLAGQNGYTNRVTTTLNKAASGTHALFTGTRFDRTQIGANPSTLTEADTVYIEGPPTAGSTVYALNVASGNVHIGGTLTADGGVSGTSAVLDHKTTPTVISNSAAETTLYSFVVPGGTLGANRVLRLSGIGSVFQNTGATQTCILKVKYGASQVVFITFNTIPVSPNAGPFNFDCEIFALTTGQQATKCAAVLGVNNVGAIFNASTGTSSVDMSQTNIAQQMLWIPSAGTVNTDSTVNQTLTVTGQLSVASAAMNMELQAAYLELK
jgi:hypothetical protein